MDVFDTFTALTFPAALSALAAARPDQDALVAPEGRVSFAELDALATEVAGTFAAAGLVPGDRVGLLLPNGMRWIAAAVGAHRAGLVAVPVNTWYRSIELAYVIETADLRLVVTADTVFGHDVHADLAAAGFGGPDGTYLGTLRWNPEDRLPAGPRGPAPDVVGTAEDLALVMFTSGSTAMPKPVPIRHGGLLRNGRATGQRMRMREGDRLWIASPFFFGFGCENAWPTAWTHATTLCLQEQVDGDAALEMIERERCTVYYAMPSGTHLLLAAPSYGSRDSSSLRTGILGFTPADMEITGAGLGITEGISAYGLTETYGFVTSTDPHDPVDVVQAGQGRPLPTQELRIVDEAGAPAPADTVGEVEVRGCVMEGYLGAAGDDPATFAPGGWFRTGDLGFLDAEGRFHFVGRWKEMLKIKGIRIAPAEVETILAQHPDVGQVHVTGMSDAAGEERMAAAIVAHKPLADLDGEAALITDLTAFVRSRAASYKVPTRFLLLTAEQIPLTDTGKVSRRSLRALFESREPRPPRHPGHTPTRSPR